MHFFFTTHYFSVRACSNDTTLRSNLPISWIQWSIMRNIPQLRRPIFIYIPHQKLLCVSIAIVSTAIRAVMVAGIGFEPTTFRVWTWIATNCITPLYIYPANWRLQLGHSREPTALSLILSRPMLLGDTSIPSFKQKNVFSYPNKNFCSFASSAYTPNWPHHIWWHLGDSNPPNTAVKGLRLRPLD